MMNVGDIRLSTNTCLDGHHNDDQYEHSAEEPCERPSLEEHKINTSFHSMLKDESPIT